MSRYRDFNDRAGNLEEGQSAFAPEAVTATIEGLSYDRAELLQIRADRSAAERFGKASRSVAPSTIFAGLRPLTSPKPGSFRHRQSLRRG